MSKVLRKLKTVVKLFPRGSHSLWYKMQREPRVYPLRFRSREEKIAHERKLGLYLTLNTYQ